MALQLMYLCFCVFCISFIFLNTERSQKWIRISAYLLDSAIDLKIKQEVNQEVVSVAESVNTFIVNITCDTELDQQA